MEKNEKKSESWLKLENLDDYSLIDYSKYYNLKNPINESININKKYPLIKEFPQKYSKDEIIPEEINIKLILKNYINKFPLLEKFASENIKIIKPKDNNFLYKIKVFFIYSKII